MTTNEIVLLITGLLVGANLTSIWHGILDLRQATRDLEATRRAGREAAGDEFLNSLELYQVQQRYGLVP